ncbi:SLBB domain-containing protein, partial [Klebsiella quasipneumoniae]|uniref:SLBB domain-containing protein n=2 Tax=Gammaproteobacteria TaxID=1236 RepID=UPI0027321581
IQLLTGLEVPSGRIPADIGIVCQNVGTATAIHRAVHFGEPLISRIVTVTGDAVAKPQNFEALIGTPFADLLDAASLYEGRLFRL